MRRKRTTVVAGVAGGVLLMAAASACGSAPQSAVAGPMSAALTASTAQTAPSSSTAPPSSAPPANDAKAVLSKICSEIPADQVASLFKSSHIKIEQDPVEEHGPWESTGCGITGSGELSLAAFAQIAPPTISAQDGLKGITDDSDVTDVRPLTGVGEADVAASFRQKVDGITEYAVCLAKRTSSGTVVIGVFDTDNHGYQPLIQLASQLAT